MALRNIRHEGDDILRKKSRKVEKLDKKILILLDDMLETMYENDGIGLAAPQIGILKRLVVIDLGEDNPIKMINPEIISREGEQTDEEGCLSVPNVKGEVIRPKKIVLRYTNEKGVKKEIKALDLMARCVCHEVDHLQGTLFIDKMIK